MFDPFSSRLFVILLSPRIMNQNEMNVRVELKNSVCFWGLLDDAHRIQTSDFFIDDEKDLIYEDDTAS
jgi:hypothetical protein